MFRIIFEVPQYFFDVVEDGILKPDQDGIDLPSDEEARRGAFALIGELAADKREPGRLIVQIRRNGEPPFYSLDLDAEE